MEMETGRWAGTGVVGSAAPRGAAARRGRQSDKQENVEAFMASSFSMFIDSNFSSGSVK